MRYQYDQSQNLLASLFINVVGSDGIVPWHIKELQVVKRQMGEEYLEMYIIWQDNVSKPQYHIYKVDNSIIDCAIDFKTLFQNLYNIKTDNTSLGIWKKGSQPDFVTIFFSEEFLA